MNPSQTGLASNIASSHIMNASSYISSHLRVQSSFDSISGMFNGVTAAGIFVFAESEGDARHKNTGFVLAQRVAVHVVRGGSCAGRTRC